MKTLLWLATVLFFLISWWWYVCPHKQVCPFGSYAERPETSLKNPTSPEVKVKDSTPPVNLGPLVFEWSSDQPITNESFSDYRDSVIGVISDNDVLEILGGFFSSEDNNTSFSDLGLARANKVRQLFGNLPDHRFELKSAEFERAAGSEKERPFLASHLRRIINNESVKEMEGKMVINFPHASDEMLDNAKLNTYLDDLVTRLKTTKEKVLLTGHTDSTSSSGRNMRLGLQRANAIKNLLVRKGLAADRITTESKGETAPIASNDSSEGRQQNRRVDLTIIP